MLLNQLWIDLSGNLQYNEYYQGIHKPIKEREMYQFKELYTIDFSNVKYYMEIHPIIQKALDFPEYYGGSLDALWDCLRDMVGEPIHIEIIGLEVIERQFGDYAAKLIETFRELKHYRGDKYSHEIQIEIVNGNTRVSLR